MTNVVENIKQEIKNTIGKSLAMAAAKGEIPHVEIPDFIIEIPREKEHGEFSTNGAMQLGKQLKTAPRQIVQLGYFART